MQSMYYHTLHYTLQSRHASLMNAEYVCPDSMINGEYVLSYSALYSAIHNVYMMNAEYLYSPLLSALYSAVRHAFHDECRVCIISISLCIILCNPVMLP